jgi:hypothetical protein
VAGDLLIVFTRLGDVTLNFPAGWTAFLNQVGAATLTRSYAHFKIANGTEGASLSVTASASTGASGTAYRISDYTGTPEVSVTTGNNVTADCPNLTPSWGLKKTLWIAMLNQHTSSVLTDPANYTNPLPAAGLSVFHRTVRRFNEVASENPGPWGNFTTGNGFIWVGATVAVRGNT